MNITELRNEPAYLLNPASLMAGASMVFSQNFEDAYIATPFDPQVEYCQEEIIRTLARVSGADGVSFQFAQVPDLTGHVNRDTIPLNLLHPNNYFHFLIESLPSLLLLVQNDVVGPNAMIVSGILHPNMWVALQYLTRHLAVPVLQLRPGQAISCERVIFPTPSFHATELISGKVSDSTYNEANVRLVRDAFKPLWAEASGLKLYIRRTANQRVVANVEETERMAVAAGYQVIDPGGFSFEEQVRLFSAASHIAGPTGAWVANLLFIREDAKVAIFYPETCRAGKTIWRSLGDICGVEVDEVYCPITLYRERQPIHSDFTIPPEALGAALRA